jgi:hypothetical protein
MLFIETRLFSKLLPNYLSDDEYRELQAFLIGSPNAGDLIQGAGGLRKIRWVSENKGKRGGVRVIYYGHLAVNRIYLMTLYAKNEVSDLSSDDKKALKQMLDNMLKRH